MKKHKVLIILSIVLLIFLSGYGLLKWDKYRKTEVIEDSSVNICNVYKENVSKIEIRDNKTFIMAYSNNQWIEEGFNDLKYDQKQMQQLVAQILGLKSIQTISNIQDKESYGINEKAITLTVYDKANTVQTFRIGNTTLDKQSYYIWSDQEELIYVVPEENMSIILMPKTKLIDTSMELPKIESINEFVINEKEEISIKRNSEIGHPEYETWIMDKPFKAIHEVSTEKFNAYAEGLQQFSKDELVSHDKNELGKYGLEDPKFSIIINKKFKLLFGNEEEDYTYFMYDNKPYIYKMTTEKINLIKEIKPFEFIRKQIYTPKLEEISKIQIINPSKTFEIQFLPEIIKQKGLPDRTIIKGKLDEKVLEENEMKEILKNMYNISIEAPLANPGLEEKEERAAEVTVKYFLKNNTEKIIEFIPFDTSFYILRTDGNVEFVTKKDQMMIIFNYLNNILKKEAK